MTHDFQNLRPIKGNWEIPASDLALWGLVFLSWGLVLLAAVTGQEHLLHHQRLFQDNSQPLLLKLIIFLVAWQVMTVAMMLPASVPLIQLFAKVTQAQQALVLPVFLAAYLTIWTGFALVACLGDLGLHHLIGLLPWLVQRPWLISGATLLLAGAFQFSHLKEHCLKACRHPLSFLTHHYQRGLKAAWNLGIRHGLYCLGCCWALMLVMFGLGVGHLSWMLLLTGVMVVEKISPWSRVLVPVVGVLLIAWGALTLLLPAL